MKKPKEKAPAFQFYPDKALAGTASLTSDAFKAYWLVLWWMWLHSHNHYTMRDTDAAWRRATLGIFPEDVLVRVRSEIMDEDAPLLQKKDEFLISKGLKKEAQKQAEWRKKSQEGGLKSAEVRSKKRKQASTTPQPHVQPKGQPKGNTPSPSISPSPSLSFDMYDGPHETTKEPNKVTLDDLLECFHDPKKCAHPREPVPIFAIINKMRGQQGITEDDLFLLVEYLHQTWEEPNVWGRATIELRRIHGRRTQAQRESEQASFEDAADKLMGQIHDKQRS